MFPRAEFETFCTLVDQADSLDGFHSATFKHSSTVLILSFQSVVVIAGRRNPQQGLNNSLKGYTGITQVHAG